MATMRMVLADKRMHEAQERRKRHNGDIDFGLYPDGADGIKAIKDVVGMKSRLAKHLGISRQAVTHWKKVPLNRLDEVAAISGIPRERLRPDIFSRK